ncbi:MAG TPA: serine/threonine-protein kinase [Gemmataceae bacterium]|nr:serine/threonine-protein kinase [Gemmataceae bacterium]
MDTTNLDAAAPAPRAPSDPLQALRSLGEVRILRPLGEGGMGFVYLGYHEGRGEHVAIKVLADHLASNQSYVDRFYREAKSGSLLNHPNIVKSITAGQDRATLKHYLVLEYIDGCSGRALLDRYGKVPVADAVHIVLDIAQALQHAHSRNVIHRDIKPDNILITRSGVAKLADMGLAKRTDEASHLTAAKQGFGTPHYMPYEQAISAKQADGRSDIYALGATLYHLVTGEVPFSGVNHLEVVEKKSIGDYERASVLNPEVPPGLDDIIEMMLKRDPRDRYQTASELILDLERSQLASPVLSFADVELAMRDPAAQRYLASAAEPTRLDVSADGAARPQVWFLRHRGPDGAWRKVRCTTAQVLRRLREGTMPAGVEACREDHDDFRPLAEFAEFRALARRLPRRARPKPRRRRTSEAEEPVVPPSRRFGWLVVGGLIAFVLAVLLLLLLSRV